MATTSIGRDTSVSSVCLDLLDGLKPWRGRGVLPHGADGWRLGCSLAGLVLLQDEGCETGRQLVHDLSLRDGLQASLKAELGSVGSVGTLFGRLGVEVRLCCVARRLGRDGEDGGLNEVRSTRLRGDLLGLSRRTGKALHAGCQWE